MLSIALLVLIIIVLVILLIGLIYLLKKKRIYLLRYLAIVSIGIIVLSITQVPEVIYSLINIDVGRILFNDLRLWDNKVNGISIMPNAINIIDSGNCLSYEIHSNTFQIEEYYYSYYAEQNYWQLIDQIIDKQLIIYIEYVYEDQHLDIWINPIKEKKFGVKICAGTM